MYFNSKLAYEKSSIFGFTASLTPAATATNVAAEQAFTVVAPVALKSTDLVFVTPPAPGNALGLAGARVNSTGQLVLNFVNTTAGSLTWPAGTFSVLVVRL